MKKENYFVFPKNQWKLKFGILNFTQQEMFKYKQHN